MEQKKTLTQKPAKEQEKDIIINVWQEYDDGYKNIVAQTEKGETVRIGGTWANCLTDLKIFYGLTVKEAKSEYESEIFSRIKSKIY